MTINSPCTRNLKRKWLFYEINPQIALRNDEDFESKAGITLQIEVMFGGKTFLKRCDDKSPERCRGLISRMAGPGNGRPGFTRACSTPRT
ncbi:MAG: hypothetical protein U9P00_12060 [Pseudomonadota bacterium]|nr:hypothetical protein [Pseudomonadota bacterium]